MTDAQKQQIRDMRQKGVVYSQIANTLDISINSIKSFCQRNNIPAGKAAVTHKLKTNIKKENCMHCGKKLEHNPKAKSKTFCCDQCRFDWWNKNRNKTNRRSLNHFICTYCGNKFKSYDKNRKYCQHSCFIAHKFYYQKEA